MKKRDQPISDGKKSGRAQAARKPLDQAYLKLIEATLNEWASAEDAAAYDNL